MSYDDTDPVRSSLDTAYLGARIELFEDESTRRAGTRSYAISDHSDASVARLEHQTETVLARTALWRMLASRMGEQVVDSVIRWKSSRLNVQGRW